MSYNSNYKQLFLPLRVMVAVAGTNRRFVAVAWTWLQSGSMSMKILRRKRLPWQLKEYMKSSRGYRMRSALLLGWIPNTPGQTGWSSPCCLFLPCVSGQLWSCLAPQGIRLVRIHNALYSLNPLTTVANISHARVLQTFWRVCIIPKSNRIQRVKY